MDLYKDNYCHIAFNKNERTHHLKWLQQPDETILLKAYNIGIDAAKRYHAIGWLADNSLAINLDLSMQRALAELTASRMNETEITRFARVVPMDVFHELVTHKVIELINNLTCNTIEIEVFSDLSDAKVWISQQDSTLASVG
ncbi:hypothetical protein [uncultured Pontibacter sp.]|uniref:hypothetical protein n=1 Tax=uncultured Pontibacter sp. TaxID=453356 RepID=UPI002636A5DF|nr:hypothetical protein [uncultured Pontibacter sp.]